MEKINTLYTIVFLCIIAYSLLIKKRAPRKATGDILLATPWWKRDCPRLAVILTVSLSRAVLFTSVPGGVNQDGAMAGVDALALATHGTDRFGTFMPSHLYAWGYGQMSALLSYMESIPIKFFGLNKFTLRFPILLMSLLGIVAIYFLVRLLWGHDAAMITGLMTAFNPWHFMQSRWALDCNLFPHFFIIGFLMVCIFITKKSRIYLYFSMLFFGLCMYCYGVSFYFMPLFLLSTCIYLIVRKRVSIPDVLVCVAVYFGVSWPEYMVMFINFMKWDTIELPFVTIQYFKDSVRVNDILFFADDIPMQLKQNIKYVIRLLLVQVKDLPWNDIKGFGTVYKCSLPFEIVGLYATVKGAFSKKAEVSDEQRCGYYLVFSYWVLGILLGLMINGINVNRINIVFYAQIILIGLGINYLSKEIRALAVPVVSMYAVLFVMFLSTYFTDFKEEISGCFFEDFTKALECAESYNCERYIITPDTQYDGAYGPTEIEIDFAFELDALYIQGKTNECGGYNVPYNERFYIANRSPEDMPNTEVCYVFRIRPEDDIDETKDFRADDYELHIYNNYGVAIPRKYVESLN